MPFKSEAQRRYLWKNEPKVAKKWSKEHPVQGTLPKKKPSLAKVLMK